MGKGAGTDIDDRVAVEGEISGNAARTNQNNRGVPDRREVNDIKPPAQFQARSTAQFGATPGGWVEFNVTQIVQTPGGNSRPARPDFLPWTKVLDRVGRAWGASLRSLQERRRNETDPATGSNQASGAVVQLV